MLAAAFTDFMQQIVSGLASGGIYALLALALVIIHRSTGVINFAQGEMATLSTYIAWTLTFNHGWSYWPAFVATLAISFVGGVGIHRAVIRPVERGSVLRIVIVTIGLLVAINGFIIWQWSGEPQQLQSPFGTETYDIGGVVVAAHDIGTIAVALGIVLLLWGLFQFTKVGLALRAAAVNPEEARLVGVRVTWMLALGWGLAALLGAVAGMLTAPTVGLDPNMMAAVLIYSFAAAVLGGIDSPIGAVVGGLAIGVLLNLLSYLSQYDMFSWFTEELRLPMALLIILAVLLDPPAGDLRQAGGEARMTPRTQRIVGFVAFAAFVAFVAVLPSFISDFKAREYSYVAIYLIALLGLNVLTGLHGPDLARPRRVHGDRRLHDRDPHGRQRAVRRADLGRDEGSLDASDRRPRRRARRARVRLPGAAPVGSLPRPRHVCDRRRHAVDGEALRGVLGRGAGDPALRDARSSPARSRT